MREDVREKALSDDPETFLADCEDSYGNGCKAENTVLFRLNYAEYDYLKYTGECDYCGQEFCLEYEIRGMEIY